eukprot:CAMPEP_0115017102 /NCGR_PEP_ID=MMETSP0216-20121206/27896_1 /TAXON_ID=223996 /ORGANISM="Protocruzia adherens, Strain Boccale" /LENGTH=187 /DNA_ID=CAMNT_0002387813 /DNA_START=100 /DNA_END=663 /DNA_ORIENTATION=+
MAFMDTFYGHQSNILAIDSVVKARVVTSGSDASCRMWKTDQGSQLLYKFPETNVDCIKCVSAEYFVTGSQGGRVSLLHASKKKPIFNTESGEQDDWITALGVSRYGDIVCSGNVNGVLQCFGVDTKERELNELFKLNVPGVINGIAIAQSANFAVIATSKEPRLGRWFVNNKGKTGIHIVKLKADKQ